MINVTRRNELTPMNYGMGLGVDPLHGMGSMLPWGSDLGFGHRTFTPLIDLWEEKDRLCLKADLPGFKDTDVEVLVEGDVLRIQGKRVLQKTDGNTHFFINQRCYGSFSVAYTLPFHVKATEVLADLTNGELSLVIPKVAATKATRVPLMGSKVKA